MFVNYLRPSLHCPAEVHQARTTTETATVTKNNKKTETEAEAAATLAATKQRTRAATTAATFHGTLFLLLIIISHAGTNTNKRGLVGEERERERGREGKEAAQANIGRHWRASSVLHVLVA